MVSNQSPGDSNLSGGQLCCRGTNFKLQPRIFTVRRRSLQLYPEGGSIKILYPTGTREMNEKQAWGSLPRYRDMKRPLGDFSPGLFLLLYEKLQDIPPRPVRWQSSLAYMTYVERCKVTKTLWQIYFTRSWLLSQIKPFYSQGLVNTYIGRCKPDLSLTSDDASLFTLIKCFLQKFPLHSLFPLVGSFTNAL